MKSKILILILLMPILLRAETITIKAIVKNSRGQLLDQYTITVYAIGSDQGNTSLGSTKVYRSTNSVKVILTKASPSIRIEISAPGYSLFSKNLADMAWVKNTVADIGTATLSRSTIPYITNILSGTNKDKSVRFFDITFSNPLNQHFLISSVTILSKLYYDENSQCSGDSPNTPTYSITDQATVLSKSGRKIELRADYFSGADEIMPVSGEIGLNDCGHYSYLKMTLFCNTKVNSDYYTIRLKLPAELRLAPTSKQKALAEYYKQVQTIILPDNPDKFKNIQFQISTDLKGAPVLSEQYAMK